MWKAFFWVSRSFYFWNRIETQLKLKRDSHYIWCLRFKVSFMPAYISTGLGVLFNLRKRSSCSGPKSVWNSHNTSSAADPWSSGDSSLSSSSDADSSSSSGADSSSSSDAGSSSSSDSGSSSSSDSVIKDSGSFGRQTYGFQKEAELLSHPPLPRVKCSLLQSGLYVSPPAAQ